MLGGMGVVFALLGLMVLALILMSRLARLLELPAPVTENAGGGLVPDAEDPELIAVVTAAIRANRGEAKK